ncbi:MAG: hypothetical protein IH924_01495 [Proteobacteria bacterium]|nr:hypothetical protein [Pseudomonadota bacterium]
MVLGGAPAHAWEIRDTLAAEKESLLRNPAYDILVVTVLAVEAADATNGNPPRVELRVEEVLRGEDRGPAVMVTWQAAVFHEDVKDSEGITEAWKARPLAGPEVTAKLIVFSIGPAEAAGVQAWSVYRFSPQNRAMVLEHAATERSGRIQIPVFFLLLALPVVIVILFVRTSSAKISPRAQRRLRQAVSALAVLTLGLYVFYESGISAYSNIRVDLIVVWPAVGTALVVGVLSLFRFRFRPKASSPPGTASSGVLAILGKSLAWGLGTALAASAAGFLAPVILGGSGSEQALLTAAIVGPRGLIIGMFLALLFQIRRALSLPIWSKTAYGLILLLLLFPFFGSVLSVSSFVFSMSTAEISGTEQRR